MQMCDEIKGRATEEAFGSSSFCGRVELHNFLNAPELV